MAHYTRYFTNESDNLRKWAVENLTPEELVDFNEAAMESSRLWDIYKDSGMVTVVPVYESIFLEEYNTNVDIQIGERVEFPNSDDNINIENIFYTNRWRSWLERIPVEIQTDQVSYD